MKIIYRFLFILIFLLTPFSFFIQGKPTNAANVFADFTLGFVPNDIAFDPVKPVFYATKTGNKNEVYAVNYLTKEIKSLKLPYPASRLELYKGTLYVTQQEMKHDYYARYNYKGAIAEIDTNHFTLKNKMEIQFDPFDIAIDEKGNLYISSASGQSVNVKVYSLETKLERPNNRSVSTYSYLYYNPAVSKLYSIPQGYTPNRLDAMEVENGVVTNEYWGTSEYSSLNPYVWISPDGSSLYNNDATVLESTKYKSGDMNPRFKLRKKYYYFAFSMQKRLTFASGVDGGIDVYDMNTNHLITTLEKDIYIEKLFCHNGYLVAIADSRIKIMNLNKYKIPLSPTKTRSFWVKPNDTAMDPNKPVMYMTKLGSKSVYAFNYSTGEMKSINLPYPAEKLELYGNMLYVTQHKMPSNIFIRGNPIFGGIAEINTSDFALKRIIDVPIDPYDFSIVNDNMYISPGLDQWANLVEYSLKTDKIVPNNVDVTGMRAYCNLYFNPVNSRLYTLATDISPRSMDAFDVSSGEVKQKYFDRSIWDYSMGEDAKITPDGTTMYNTSGDVFNLTEPDTGIVKYLYKLPKRYNDYEFSIDDQMTFAAGKDAGIDVYKYESGKFLYTLRKDLHVTKLYMKNGKLVALCTEGNGKYFLESVNTQLPVAGSEIIAPLDYLNGVSGTETLNGNYYYAPFTNGVNGISLGSFFIFHFTQPFTLKDASEITLKGPNGTITSTVQAMDDTLTLSPDLLNKNTAYTLTIKKDALLGEQGQNLEKDVVLNFQTGSNWEKHNGKLFFYDQKLAAFAVKWNKIDNGMYYFNDFGEMQNWWKKIGNSTYYFSNSGVMKTGWLKVNKKMYYLDTKTGEMHKNWLKLNKKWYHLDSKNGFLQTGWIQIDKKWHYFDLKTGILKLGWVQATGKKRFSYPH